MSHCSCRSCAPRRSSQRAVHHCVTVTSAQWLLLMLLAPCRIQSLCDHVDSRHVVSCSSNSCAGRTWRWDRTASPSGALPSSASARSGCRSVAFCRCEGCRGVAARHVPALDVVACVRVTSCAGLPCVLAAAVRLGEPVPDGVHGTRLRRQHALHHHSAARCAGGRQRRRVHARSTGVHWRRRRSEQRQQ